ncbi:unnamed protein product [Tetraodon nigroviridis]|uniref:(spotted green pufferfish) hypothetical protein n=1 Tax=Tetraodon nigroviridis TaxID=99883 RepID=Q4S7J0_TETNG|nr:unnamed protein product [Tetraodon nigroviridis]
MPTQTWSRPPKHLLLARNRIKVLRQGGFLGYDSVTSLDLQQNQISFVEEGAFQGLGGLTTLLLQHNRLETLSEETLIPMPGLTYLRLYHNPWNCLCPLDSLIRTLQIPSNRNLGNHARCAEPIQLKGRKLKQVNPEMLCLDPQTPGDPTEDPGLPTDPRPIRTKADATTTCHTYLYPDIRMDCSNRGKFLDDGRLTEVPAGVPEDVVHIDLSNNSISHLKAKDFLGTKSLRTLNISRNHMQHADTGSFSGLLHLQILDLSSNNLHFIQYGVLEDLYFLSELKLGGNPWVCDYSIHYMVYWLHLHPGVKHSGLTAAPLWNTRGTAWRSTSTHTTTTVPKADGPEKPGQTQPRPNCGPRRKKRRETRRRRSRNQKQNQNRSHSHSHSHSCSRDS